MCKNICCHNCFENDTCESVCDLGACENIRPEDIVKCNLCDYNE